jgi:hypothetical protein
MGNPQTKKEKKNHSKHNIQDSVVMESEKKKILKSNLRTGD